MIPIRRSIHSEAKDRRPPQWGPHWGRRTSKDSHDDIAGVLTPKRLHVECLIRGHHTNRSGNVAEGTGGSPLHLHHLGHVRSHRRERSKRRRSYGRREASETIYATTITHEMNYSRCSRCSRCSGTIYGYTYVNMHPHLKIHEDCACLMTPPGSPTRVRPGSRGYAYGSPPRKTSYDVEPWVLGPETLVEMLEARLRDPYEEYTLFYFYL